MLPIYDIMFGNIKLYINGLDALLRARLRVTGL